mgnify:CR=1 FL=1
MKIYFIKIFIVFSFCVINISNAQMQTEWVRRYYQSRGYALDLDDSGNVFVTGAKDISASLTVCTTIKYNSSGDSIWVRDYQRSGTDLNVGRDMFMDNINSCIYVAGSVSLLKYNSDGELLWAAYDAIAFYKVVMDQEGNIYAGGMGSGKYGIVKYDQNGNIFWKRNNIGGYKFRDMKVDGNGNILILGESLTGGGSDYTTIKYSKSGALLWMKKYYGLATPPQQSPGYLTIDDKNNIYVAGASYGASAVYNSTTIKYDSSGNEVWVKRIYPPSDGDGIAVDNEYNVYYAARTSSNNYAIKLNQYGDLVWMKTYPLTNALVANRLVVFLDSAKNFYMTATLNDPNTQYGVIKYDSDGNRQYVLSYSANPTSYNYVQDMKVDRNGSVYITGESNNSIATVKYSILTNISPSQNTPSDFYLQNYPNPFNPSTNISFKIPSNGNVKLSVHDIDGKELKVLVNEFMTAGSHSINFTALDFSSGIYFYSLSVDGNLIGTKKMILLK